MAGHVTPRHSRFLRSLMPSASLQDVSPAVEEAEPRERTTYRRRFTALGILLSVGAPVGALLLRILFGPFSRTAELAHNAFFYLYILVGTSIVFAAAGLIAGRFYQA